MKNPDPGKLSLRKFGITMGVALLAAAAIIMVRHRFTARPLILISLGFFLASFIYPAVLKPFYIIWMKFANMLGWFNTRLILVIIFYLLLTPIGLAMRLFGGLLDTKLEKDKETYWIEKEKKEFAPSDYKRQF